MNRNDASDRRALRIVLFAMVLIACLVAAFLVLFSGWKAGIISLLILMLPAVAIYRYGGK